MNAVLAAAGYNLRWLLRAILDGKIKPVFLRQNFPRLWAELWAWWLESTAISKMSLVV